MGGRFIPWTDSETEYLRTHYATSQLRELSQALNRSKMAITAKANKLGLKKAPDFVPDHCGFKPGHQTWNKGKRHRPAGSEKGQFKPGGLPPTTKPVGSERRASRDGVLYRKVCDKTHEWKAVHVMNWEAKHGPLPDGVVVTFRDGNPQNPDIENLTAMNRDEVMRRNTLHRYPKEVVGAIQQLAWLKRRIKEASA
jgi:hypothetical protein